MEPPGGIQPDRDKFSVVHQQPNISTTTVPQNLSLVGVSTTTGQQQSLERLSRPLSFDKMESLVREMQDTESGVPVRQQKMFLTSIPYAFMGKIFEVPIVSTNVRAIPYVGYDLIEWLMDRLAIEESEALSIANQLCLHGYFFPVNDTKSLIVKDDSSLYRFQTPYYWPWQHKAPDNVEYAIYLAKRSLRNKQRHGLEDYESEALASLHKNLKGKWDFISMQAEEQVRLAKERKKGDKIVGDSQERAYWRVHRPPPGQFTPLEPCPVPSRDRQGIKPKKKTAEDWQRDVDYLKKSLGRTRMKMSQACESLVNYWETFADYDFFIQPVLPSNPWVSEDTTFWQLNNAIVDIPTEKRVKRWAISVEELVSDPTGLQEFTNFLEKEYSHENIRFWIAVNRLRRSAHSQVAKKVNEIYAEFLKPGAPCEINIDGKTMEVVQKGLKNPSRFTFDAAAEHIYMLLLKKDCYPRFIRSDHYKSLLASGIQPSHKKRFFNFGGVAKKKSSSAVAPNQTLLTQSSTSGVPPPGSLSRRRGSDRSLTGSAHELAIIGVKDGGSASHKVPHSHSQSNLSEIPYSVTVYRGDMPTEGLVLDVNIKGPSSTGRHGACSMKLIQEANKPLPERLEPTAEAGACAVCPWETPEQPEASVVLSVCPWDEGQSPAKTTPQPTTSSPTDISEVSERMRRSCGLRQNTVDSDYSTKKLMPTVTEQRRASMTMAPRIYEFQANKQCVIRVSTTPSPTAFIEMQIAGPSLPKEATSASEAEDNTNTMLSTVITTENSPPSNDDRDETKNISETCDKSDLKTLDLSKENSTNNIEQESVVLNLSTEKISDKLTTMSQGTTPTIHVECPIGEPVECESPQLIGKSDQVVEEAESMDDDVKIDEEVKAYSQPIRKSLEVEEELSVCDEPVPQEELSPTTEEYQECAQFGGRADVYEYDIVDAESNITPGCVAPAPTPAPTLAPLAEIEMDPVDEDTECTEVKPEMEEIKKKRKKKESDAKKPDEKAESSAQQKSEEENRNAVCPWEDENGTTSDTPFVKTYATLGYL